MPPETVLVSSSSTPRALKARYRRIMRFAFRALAQTWWFELVLPQFGLSRLAAKGRIKRVSKLARRFQVLAADLSGLMIKLGQFLSSRLDILPVEITRELEGLQDSVAAEPEDAIKAQIELALGMPLAVAFESFNHQPIAAASLGQAHQASLSKSLAEEVGYSAVVVKVLRPGIESIVQVDITALRRVGVILSKIRLVSRRADAPALVEEFALTCSQEINYLHEAANLERFRKDFESDPRVLTPDVIWERSSRRVLTLSDVTAIKITDIDSLVEAGIDPNAVAAELARVTFEQFFVSGFFHADPHPGNIFVTPRDDANEGDFSFTFIDFGMMGEITAEVKANLQRLIFALALRDPRASLEATMRLKFLLPSADTVELEKALTTLFERFGGVGVSDLIQTDPKEIRDLAFQYSKIVRTLPFQLPENFLLLFRSLSLISGVTSSLNKNFNLWDALDPFARTLLNGSGGGIIRTFASQLGDLALTVLRLPQRLDSLVTRAERGEISGRNTELEKQLRVLDSTIRRTTSAVLFGTLLGLGIYLRESNGQFGEVLLVASVVPLIYALGLFRRK